MTISQAQRQAVRERAGDCCEYCRLPASGGTVAFHVDHIVPLKHGGSDDSDNLCLACYKCNAHKGHDLTGVDPQTQQITRLFHPATKGGTTNLSSTSICISRALRPKDARQFACCG